RRDRRQASARTGNRRRSRRCVLVPRERRVAVDDGIGDRRRRRLLGTVGGSVEEASPMRADMSWNAVLEHHAVRTPDKPLAIFGNETVTYAEMSASAAGRAAGRRDRGVKGGDVVGLLSYNCSEFLETIFAANVRCAI